MKIVFAGPSLHGTDIDTSGIALRAPAVQGDVLRAVRDGAAVVGLIDGSFEATASVWHKEILYAIEQGTTVVGGASMGALRAAECAAFGMIAVGEIARRYLSGDLDDDAWVAVTHGPAELGSPPLTEAMADCEATLRAMSECGLLTAGEARRICRIAATVFYKDRTPAEIAARAFPGHGSGFEALYRQYHVSVKAADAAAVLAVVRSLPDERTGERPHWALNRTPHFTEPRA